MQTIPASVQLGYAYVGATGIGLRTVQLDKTTTVAAFTTTGVTEAPVSSGQFQRAGGIQAHDDGGYIVWGTSGTDVLWVEVWPTANVDCGGDGKIEFTYTLTSSQTGQPIAGATIRFTSDSAGLITLWTGTTDVLGVARNLCGDKPRLDAGTVFVFRSHPSFTFSPEPDVENVS